MHASRGTSSTAATCPRLIGVPAALRLLYTGAFLSATEALELGYVAAVVEPDDLMDTARAEAERFLAGSPFSQRLIKELVYRGLERELTDHMHAHVAALQACFRSADHKEGVEAFLQRREPRFSGR